MCICMQRVTSPQGAFGESVASSALATGAAFSGWGGAATGSVAACNGGWQHNSILCVKPPSTLYNTFNSSNLGKNQTFGTSGSTCLLNISPSHHHYSQAILPNCEPYHWMALLASQSPAPYRKAVASMTTPLSVMRGHVKICYNSRFKE